MLTCPCCGGPMASQAPVEALSQAPVPNQQRRILDALASAYPNDVTKAQLIDALYWDDIDGGPDDPSNVIGQQICRLRPVLASYGWTIPTAKGGRGSYGRYRLMPLEKAHA